ncbi:Isotrichodermin C-15 hydroxylase [Cytospora mali]|uniref:Isotrichodermin C-15 hydroxylase n=1 Tax=Cytospora mali TaxID=578113 RepID=A0A194W268_CYTMA|nr:Isotrichodermin C-15 hydroxylase [Valsa mali]
MAPILENYYEYLTLGRLSLAGTVLAITLSLGQFIYNIYFHPLAHFPGPLLWRGSNLPKIISQLQGNIHHRMLEFHQQYGPVVRLAPNELTYTTATALKEIYGNRNGKKPMPPQFSLGSHEKKMFGATSFIWLESHQEHHHHRRIFAQSFSDNSLKAQEPVIQGYTTLMMERFRERAARGEAIDLWAWFNFYTFDIIGDLTFSESFDCVRRGQFHPWISFIFSNLTNMMYVQMVTTMGFLGTFIQAIVPRKVMAQAHAHAQSTRDKVDRRLARKADRPDIVSSILAKIDQPGGITREELYADSQILLMAGSETGATLLAVAVYYLLRNPDKLARLREEIRGSFSDEEEMGYAPVSKMPYLLAVINEALRIHPSLPAGINRFVPQGGAMIDGKYVAEGTILQVPHWATFHLEENFTDPWEFVPERWLDDCPERYAGDNREVFQPFSFGQRNCIGRGLALMETRLCLARLVLNFDMELMQDSEDWTAQRVYLLYEKRPLNVRLVEAVKGEKM